MSTEQDTNMSQLQSLLDSIDLWPVAVASPKEFSRGGLYYQEVKHQFRDKFVDGIHFMLKGFPSKKFCYSEQKDSIELCLGLTHIPIRQLTTEEEKLAQVVATAALEDSSEDTGGSTSYGYLTPSKESEKSPRAFSGKGHSLLPTSSSDTG